jgi:excinuclease ABC subunit B
MANVIQKLQVPTLIISHNKTLAAQLATEFKHFFPNNAVHYFVSYFDYYQPESYLPAKDIYIEKEATVNAEIEMYRLSAMASLLTRPDTIIVSSVSALYGLGDKEFFNKYSLRLKVGDRIKHKELKSKLIDMQYETVKQSMEQ